MYSHFWHIPYMQPSFHPSIHLNTYSTMPSPPGCRVPFHVLRQEQGQGLVRRSWDTSLIPSTHVRQAVGDAAPIPALPGPVKPEPHSFLVSVVPSHALHRILSTSSLHGRLLQAASDPQPTLSSPLWDLPLLPIPNSSSSMSTGYCTLLLSSLVSFLPSFCELTCHVPAPRSLVGLSWGEGVRKA